PKFIRSRSSSARTGWAGPLEILHLAKRRPRTARCRHRRKEGHLWRGRRRMAPQNGGTQRRQNRGGGAPMTLVPSARPQGGAARGVCSLVANENNPDPKKSSIKNQAERQPSCPILIASQCRLTADLLAECLESAIASGTGILRAVRECDDPGIFDQFRLFD